jgi:glycosyltransferase involved in cell wall biosynthesis
VSICFVLKGYPRLSETFIAQEILALEQRGIEIHIASLRHPTDTERHPIHHEISATVDYLPEYLHDEPSRVFSAWNAARRLPGYRAANAAFHADLQRDLTRNRVRRFGQACVLAVSLPMGTERLHAHFLHTPASVARYAALMTGLPWSCSAHAKDIWTTPQWEIREKLAALDWLVTCTAFGADYLEQHSPRPETVSLLYHGLDFTRFGSPRDSRPVSNGTGDAVRILSVGRAVAKKGYEDLLTALAKLPADLNWRFIHIGGGPLLDSFREKATTLSLADRIEWRGPQSQGAVLAALREADIFALTSKIAKDGDRDGLPNVLMEAQSQALPVMATNTAGIPELIVDNETGLLTPASDPLAAAEALTRLIRDPALRQRLGDAGLHRVRTMFSLDAGADELAVRFGNTKHPAAA